jgi:tRNA-dihydrouridine synthase B
MSFWHEKITIKNLSFPRFIGGPLDGITDSPFRKLVREFSKDELLYSEMRHVGCVANEKGGVKALEFEQMERPLNFQFAANKIDFIERAVVKVLDRGVDMIDLNIGCPANNVIGSGSGSALMADLPRLTLIVKEFRRVIPAHMPFTVKIRAGFKCKNALEVAQLLQDCGADALAIHPRLQTQKFEGRPDYELVAEVKKALSIPVIVSGGIVNWATARMVYEQTGVDGFLIGRGIWAKPWKLQELRAHSQGEPYLVTMPLVIEYALKHLDFMLAYYGAHGLFVFRKHIPFYIRGLPDASLMRQKLVTSTSVDQVRETFSSMIGNNGSQINV